MAPRVTAMNTEESTPSASQGKRKTDNSSPSEDILSALAFTPNSLGGKSGSFDDWSDPREDVVDHSAVLSPLGSLISLHNTWASPLPVFVTDQMVTKIPPKSKEKEGVSVPPLMKAFLGVGYLPYSQEDDDEVVTPRTSGTTATAGATTTSQEDDLVETVSELNEDLNSLILDLDDSYGSHSRNEETPSRGRKKPGRRISKSIGKLTSKVRTVGRERRTRRRDRLGSSDSRGGRTPTRELDDQAWNRQRAASLPADMSTADWVTSEQDKLDQQKVHLEVTLTEIQTVQLRTKAISSHVSKVQKEVLQLEESLAEALKSLERDTDMLKQAKHDLSRLEAQRVAAALAVEETASSIRQGAPLSAPRRIAKETPPLSPRCTPDDEPELNPMLSTPRSSNLAETPSRSAPPIRRVLSSSFIRVHDLEIDNSLHETSSSLSDLSSTECCACPPSADGLVFLDSDVTTVLNALAKTGFDLVTDETSRFVPVLNTERLLSRCPPLEEGSNWPLKPWHCGYGKEVLVWTGNVKHDGHGSHLPVVKARGIVPAPPRQIVDLILDSSRSQEYNKMSQGRNDIVYLQKGLDTTAEESEFSLAGEAKITQSLNRPPMIRRNIEMLSLLYARPLKDMDGYLSVSRSVWEDSSGTAKASNDTVRSEILLSVNLFRPIKGPNGTQHCELTTITHAHTTVVPEYISKKMGPSQAVKFFQEIQKLF